jgi:hypothetical protein
MATDEEFKADEKTKSQIVEDLNKDTVHPGKNHVGDTFCSSGTTATCSSAATTPRVDEVPCPFLPKIFPPPVTPMESSHRLVGHVLSDGR